MSNNKEMDRAVKIRKHKEAAGEVLDVIDDELVPLLNDIDTDEEEGAKLMDVIARLEIKLSSMKRSNFDF